MPLSGLILDALFPDACLSCLAPRDATNRHEVACDSCLRGVPLPRTLSCSACNAPSATARPPCHRNAHCRLALAPAESRVVGELVAALLFDGIDRAAAPLGELLAAGVAAVSLPLHRTHVAPVPTFPTELRERGYDANLLVAREVATLLDLPLAPYLLTADRHGRHAAYGIGEPGDAASANLVALVSVTSLRSSIAAHCASLASAACPHADVALLACTT